MSIRRTFVGLVFSMCCLYCLTYVESNDCVYFKHDSLNYISKATFKNYTIKNCSDIRINFKNSRIRTVYNDAFNGMHNLKNIFLNNNTIEYLDIATFRDTWKLQLLDLSNNQIEAIETGLFSNLSQLKYLPLYKNKLQAVEPNLFADLISLKYLYLHHNFITELDKNIFRYNPNLKVLNLSSNRIIHVDVALFQNNLALIYVGLDSNNIKYIQDGLFTNLTHLNTLNVSANVIHNISKNAFPVSSTLWYIDVSNNQLEHLDANLFNNLTGLISLKLHDNTWFCDYKLKDLHALYTKLKSYQEPMCNQPMELRNRTWNSLNQFDFQSFAIQSHQMRLHEDLATFSCYIKADPVPKVTWYYNNDLLHEETSHQSNHSYTFTKEDLGNGTLVFYLTVPIVHLKETDTFLCHAADVYGIALRVFNNFIKNPGPILHTKSLFVGFFASILFIALIVAILAFSYWIKMKFKEPEPDFNDFHVKEVFELLEEHEAKQRIKRQTKRIIRV